METNYAINLYRNLPKIDSQPKQKSKGGLLSKTGSSTRSKKHTPNVDVSMRVARYVDDIRNYSKEEDA
tara:strand:- start:259 stop:462 length:204 start_codon:yes stop_codon:yes gene_type:complete